MRYFQPRLLDKKRNFVLDKMASAQAVKQKLEEMKLEADNEKVQKIINYAKLKEKGTVSNNEIYDIFTDCRNIDNMFQ